MTVLTFLFIFFGCAVVWWLGFRYGLNMVWVDAERAELEIKELKAQLKARKKCSNSSYTASK